jgi:hypothetical protein
MSAAPPVSPIRRMCRGCARAFEIGPDEQAFLRKTFGADLKWPKYCSACRTARRLARHFTAPASRQR